MIDPLKSSDNTTQDDIYATYRPKSLKSDRIREPDKIPEEKYYTLEEAEFLVARISETYPPDTNLINQLIELKPYLSSTNASLYLLEQIRIILYFEKHGYTPDSPSIAFSRKYNLESFRSLLKTTLSGFPVELNHQRKVVDRLRGLLSGLFARKGELPNSSDPEVSTLYRAIKRGEYKDVGIWFWDDIMFMTFGRNYFKYRIERFEKTLQKEIKSKPVDSILDQKKVDVLSRIQWYQTALSLDDSFQPEIDKTYGIFNTLIPKSLKIRHPRFLAEIVIFHVLKENKSFTNWDLFVLISPLGNMALNKRWWLLEYKKYTTLKEKLSIGGENPDSYLKKLYDSNMITEEIKMKCEKNKEVLIRNFKHILPRISAGIACYLAIKNTSECPISIAKALALMGINYPGSIVNAVKSMKSRREYNDELFV